ncbi:hypothetical protein ABW04_20395 [Priestia megaterium]|nr:hypothetical protein ABW04_20395 [Priestia megaterium]PAK48362.1 hypothetical protein CHH47_17120 [Priestia megaterium]
MTFLFQRKKRNKKRLKHIDQYVLAAFYLAVSTLWKSVNDSDYMLSDKLINKWWFNVFINNLTRRSYMMKT